MNSAPLTPSSRPLLTAASARAAVVRSLRSPATMPAADNTRRGRIGPDANDEVILDDGPIAVSTNALHQPNVSAARAGDRPVTGAW